MKQPNLTKSLLYMLTSNFLVLAVFFVTTIALARLLGPHNLGVLMAGESFVNLFSFFFAFGFRNSMLKLSAKHENGMAEGLNTAIGNALLIKSVMLIPAAALVYFAAKATNPSPELMFVITCYIAMATMDSFAKLFGIVRRALGQFKLISLINTGNRVLRLGIIFGVLLYIGGLKELVMAFVVFSFFKLLISFVTTVRLFKVSTDPSQIRPMIAETFKYGLFDALDQMQTGIDRVMLSSISGAAAVGFYSIPAKLNKLTKTIPNTINQVFLPKLYELEHEPEKFSKLIAKISRFLTLCGSGMFLFIYYFSEPILLRLFGAEYADAVSIVQIFAFINLLWFLDKTPNIVLAVRSAHQKRLIPLATSIALNVIFNLILIPKMGIIGAAFATLSANIIKLVVLYFFTARDLDMIKVIAIAGSAIGLAVISPYYIAIPAYLLILYFFKLVSWEDIEAVKLRLFNKGLFRKKDV